MRYAAATSMSALARNLPSRLCHSFWWTPWELGLAYAFGKKVCVFYVDKNADVPEYLGLYDKVEMGNEDFLVSMHGGAGERVSIKDWIFGIKDNS